LFISGLGFGISAITSLSQMSLYFSTWKSFANGFVLSGSTTFGAVYPFLNQYLIDECGWRGAFLVSGGIALNICAAGSLIRPISVISKKKSRENETSDCVISQPIDHLQHDKRLTSSSCFNFVIRYWVGLGFLIADFAFSMAMYAPNVFVVPYTEELGLKTSESVLLLSLLSFGDFLGRLGSGLAASKIKFLRKNVLFLMTACIFVLSGIEIFPIFYATLPFLLVYVIVYGLAIGASITLSFSVIGEILDSAVVEMAIAMMFASDGIALLVSGPATGENYCECELSICKYGHEKQPLCQNFFNPKFQNLTFTDRSSIMTLIRERVSLDFVLNLESDHGLLRRIIYRSEVSLSS